MTLRLTNSEMKDWRRCRRKWWLGDHRGLQKRGWEPFNSPLSIGSRIHDVFAVYYVPGYERPDPMQFFEEQLARDLEEHPAMEKDIRKEADLCRKMLEGYFAWLEEEGIDSDLTVIEPESEMESPLVITDDDVVLATVLSKIDARVERSDGKRGALEHKTTPSLTDPVRRLQTDTQLLTEHLVEYLHHLEVDPSAIDTNRAQFILYNMLRKVKRTANAKPPFYGREEVQHSVQELRSHWQHVHQQAIEILEMKERLDAGESPDILCYPNPTRDCSWDCPFSEPCLSGMFDDGSDVESYLAEEFEQGDPLERYRSSVGLAVKPGTPTAE